MKKPAFLQRPKIVKEAPPPEKKPVTLAERHFAFEKARDALMAACQVLEPGDGADGALAQAIDHVRLNFEVRLKNERRIATMAKAEIADKPAEDKASI